MEIYNPNNRKSVSIRFLYNFYYINNNKSILNQISIIADNTMHWLWTNSVSCTSARTAATCGDASFEHMRRLARCARKFKSPSNSISHCCFFSRELALVAIGYRVMHYPHAMHYLINILLPLSFALIWCVSTYHVLNIPQ